MEKEGRLKGKYKKPATNSMGFTFSSYWTRSLGLKASDGSRSFNPGQDWGQTS